MGCGKAHSARAATTVDEPQYQQKAGDQRPKQYRKSAADELSLPAGAVDAASDLRSSASSTAKVRDECPAEPCTALAQDDVRDLVPRPPKPPPPPSVTARKKPEALGEQAMAVKVSYNAVTSPSREAAGSPSFFAGSERNASLRPLSNLPAAGEPPPSAPVTENASLRAAGSATSAVASSANADLGALGPPEASQPSVAADASLELELPGAICTTPQNRSSLEKTGKSLVSKPHVGKAFAALESPSANSGIDIDSALALLTAEDDTGDDERKGYTTSPSAALQWPRDVYVAPSSRVLLLTWARWSRNGLRSKAEDRIKAMQHIKHPKTKFRHSPRTPPLSPQPTPRSGELRSPRQGLGEGAMPCLEKEPLAMPLGIQPLAPPPTRVGGNRHASVASRSRNANGTSTQGRLLFDVMAEERRAAAEAQGVKIKLQKNFAIEDAHTADPEKTPGFGTETPNFPFGASTSASRMSNSVASSGVVSPMAGGQMSPWLLEAEAIVNGEEDDYFSPGRDIPTSSAWGFEPNRLSTDGAWGRLPDVPEAADPVCEELDDLIDDEDELERVGIFVTAGVTAHDSDADGLRCPPALPAADSRASTATSPAGATDTRSGCASSHGSPLSLRSGNAGAGAGRLCDDTEDMSSPELPQGRPNLKHYTIGEKVSYWSGTKGVWLPAVVVEKKSSSVYVIDKQMKGCLAKVRSSELISAAEEKRDPVLRALAAFGEPTSASRSGTPRGDAASGASRTGTPRGGNSGTPRSRTGTPRGEGHGSAQKRDRRQGDVRGTPTPEREPGIHRHKGEFMGLPQKAPTIRAALPAALGGSTSPASRSPVVTPRSRGKIVRDDFSDDSEED